MKKAFDLNVSRAKPRLRLGGQVAGEAPPPAPEASTTQGASADASEPTDAPSAALASEVRARAEDSRRRRPTATEAVAQALDAAEAPAPDPEQAIRRPIPRPAEPEARVAAPPHTREVQDPNPTVPDDDPEVRRERLRQRLLAVRENPRPEPLPPTVAEAGVLAVERIATLQQELSHLKELNLALTQDLESARRTAERATEEARVRMDEAHRLSVELEGRASLLTELERELSSLEGERNETLLALQEARRVGEAQQKEREDLSAAVAEKNKALLDSLAEEERLADELESAHDTMGGLRRATDALRVERDTLARQVADLTRERVELLEARRALESVHRALSKATVR